MACSRQQWPAAQPAAAAGSCHRGCGRGPAEAPTVRALRPGCLPTHTMSQLGTWFRSHVLGMPLPCPAAARRKRLTAQRALPTNQGLPRPLAHPCRQKSLDETPLRDANRDRLMGLLTERWVQHPRVLAALPHLLLALP